MDQESPKSVNPADRQRRNAVVIGSLLIPIAALGLNWLAISEQLPADRSEQRPWLVPVYLMAATMMTVVLPVTLWVGNRFPNHCVAKVLIGKVLLFGAIVTSLFWIAVPLLVLGGFLYYTHADPMEVVQLSLAVFFGSIIVAEVFIQYRPANCGKE